MSFVTGWWRPWAAAVASACVLSGVLGLVMHLGSWQVGYLLGLTAVAWLLMCPVMVGVVLFATLRWWLPTAGAVLVLVAVALTQAPLYLGGSSVTGGVGLRVLQANLRVGRADPKHLVALVRREHIDLAVTVEVPGHELDRLIAAGMPGLLPYRLDDHEPSENGVVIWSRYRLTDEQSYPDFELGVASAALTVAGHRVVILGVHLHAPYPYRPQQWSSEAVRTRAIMMSLAREDTSVLVAGDFNATTDTSQYRALAKAPFQDAAEQTNAGYLPTYPVGHELIPPLMGIDHLLGDTQIRGWSDVHAVDLAKSDHRGLVGRARIA